MVKLKVNKTSIYSKVPQFAYNDPSNAGADIFSSQKTIIWPKTKKVIKTSISICPVFEPTYPPRTPIWFKEFIEKNYKLATFIKSRSGLSMFNSIEHGAGVIDQGYTGECKVILYNHGWLPKKIIYGEKIAQLVPLLLPKFHIEEFDRLDDTIRRAKGFGSSGKL